MEGFDNMSKKMVGFRLEEETIGRLKIYAIENHTTVQKVLEDYVLDLLKRYAIHPHS